jgi:hypothetical protein
VTKVTYKTHPDIPATVVLSVNVTYTPASKRELLKSFLSLQPTWSAHNISGYSYPAIPVDPITNSSMLATILIVPNSDDIEGTNSTVKPLYDFVASEEAAGRHLNVSSQGFVLPNYYLFWNVPIDQVDEGAGGSSILGSRLLPASLFEEGKVDGLADLLTQTQLFPIFHLGELTLL